MCGIAGSFGLADRAVIRRMVEAQTHRGPDDEGIYIDGVNQIALGHRRLAIIDLSCAAHQPMSYADGRFWITYQGEVYNFAEIRQELEKLGYLFRSHSDTEVVLAAYAQWSESCLGHFRGMFAFAIWDAQNRELFLARDRFGIKPLLYARVGNIFLFASELKALLASGLIERRVDKQAVWDYLSLGSVLQPRTILPQVKALPAGCWLRLKAKEELKIQRYWDIVATTKRRYPCRLTYEEAKCELRRLLEEATRLHLIADVPVGAFLSGGIDSSTVVGLMSRLVSKPIKTYSVGFEDKHRRLNELYWAKIAAQQFGTDHTEVIVTETDISRSFETLIEALDQPSHDGANIYLVSQAARQAVTVALCGLGGDELFAGYPQFSRYNRWDGLAPAGIPLLGKFAKILPRRFRGHLEYITSSSLQRLARVRRFFDEGQKYAIANPEFHADFTPRSLEDWYVGRLQEDLDPVAQVSYMELTGYLSDTLLRDTDAASMFHALEVRPVLLDYVFAEYVFALPPVMKLRHGQAKVLLIEAMRDILPTGIIRRKKMYFRLPLLVWLEGPLRKQALALLEGKIAHQLFTSDFIKYCSCAVMNTQKAPPGLWAIIVLLAWIEHYRVSITQ